LQLQFSAIFISINSEGQVAKKREKWNDGVLFTLTGNDWVLPFTGLGFKGSGFTEKLNR
jgi:hypothetical protein